MPSRHEVDHREICMTIRDSTRGPMGIRMSRYAGRMSKNLVIPRTCGDIRAEIDMWDCGTHLAGQSCRFNSGQPGTSECGDSSWFRYRDLVVIHLAICDDSQCDLNSPPLELDHNAYMHLREVEWDWRRR